MTKINDDIAMMISYDGTQVEPPGDRTVFYFATAFGDITLSGWVDKPSATAMASFADSLARRLQSFDWDTGKIHPRVWERGMWIPPSWIGEEGDDRNSEDHWLIEAVQRSPQSVVEGAKFVMSRNGAKKEFHAWNDTAIPQWTVRLAEDPGIGPRIR